MKTRRVQYASEMLKGMILMATMFSLLWVFLCAVPMAQADEVLINSKIDDVRCKVSKKGNDYAMLFITETKEISGYQYQKQIPIFAFGDLAAQAKHFKPGDTVKAIVTENEYNGNKNYRAVLFIKDTPVKE